MKKLLCLLTVVLISLGFAACLGGCAGDNGGLITVGFAQCYMDESDWRRANTQNVKEALSKENGFDLTIVDSGNDSAKQMQDVQDFIDQGVDYILLSASEDSGWDAVLKNAKDAEIPVVLLDRTINSTEDLWTCWTGADFKAEGVKAVDWLETKFAEAEEVGILHIQGQTDAAAQKGRTEALDEGAMRNGWTILEQHTANWSTDEAKELVAEWIKKHGDRISAVYAENDNMAKGAIEALEEAGVKYGGADGIAIISFDANREYLQMTLEGKINVNVECNPLLGDYAREMIEMLERGEQPPKRRAVYEEVFYWDTITQEMIDARKY